MSDLTATEEFDQDDQGNVSQPDPSESKVEFTEESDSGLDIGNAEKFSSAVLHSADWTVETIISQLVRWNIELSPRFQRRDAWGRQRKSKFIESLILGLPVPQIVLAERTDQRWKYIVLDGKQRLLSLMQFTGQSVESNFFRLSSLEARSDLNRKNYKNLQEPAFENVLNAFLNYTIRTVVIRNWPSHSFLHMVFLRLNTWSVKLSPQELRQAMFPGGFSDYIDDAAKESSPLQKMLGNSTFDSRMRDVELLVRFLGFRLFLSDYAGRMKDFLDLTCERLNKEWLEHMPKVEEAVKSFNDGISCLLVIFEQEKLARKENSNSFNRAIFDALIFFASNQGIRVAMIENKEAVIRAYSRALAQSKFLDATESDTASISNTCNRLSIWGGFLKSELGMDFSLPYFQQASEREGVRSQIRFSGF